MELVKIELALYCGHSELAKEKALKAEFYRRSKLVSFLKENKCKFDSTVRSADFFFTQVVPGLIAATPGVANTNDMEKLISSAKIFLDMTHLHSLKVLFFLGAMSTPPAFSAYLSPI